MKLYNPIDSFSTSYEELNSVPIEEIKKGKSNKEAPIGEKKVFAGKIYIKTAEGWKYVGKPKNATNHYINDEGLHKIDTLDPDTSKKVFKEGDIVKVEIEGKRLHGKVGKEEKDSIYKLHIL